MNFLLKLITILNINIFTKNVYIYKLIIYKLIIYIMTKTEICNNKLTCWEPVYKCKKTNQINSITTQVDLTDQSSEVNLATSFTNKDLETIGLTTSTLPDGEVYITSISNTPVVVTTEVTNNTSETLLVGTFTITNNDGVDTPDLTDETTIPPKGVSKVLVNLDFGGDSTTTKGFTTIVTRKSSSNNKAISSNKTSSINPGKVKYTLWTY